MGSRWLLLLLCLLPPSALLAQSPTPSSAPAEPTVQSLLERIQLLEKRINQLEDHERTQETALAAAPAATAPSETATQAPIATPAPPPLATPGPGAQHEDHASMGEIRDTERRFPSLQIRGFGD